AEERRGRPRTAAAVRGGAPDRGGARVSRQARDGVRRADAVGDRRARACVSRGSANRRSDRNERTGRGPPGALNGSAPRGYCSPIAGEAAGFAAASFSAPAIFISP